MLSMISRGQIKDSAVVKEFEHLIGRLRGFLSQSFDEDGLLIVADPNLAIFTVGDYKPSARPTDHSGWLLCDGRQVSRVTYKSLFDIVGVTYGVGDGSTTFNIPNLQGRFLLGKATSGTGSTLGGTGGAIDHTHSMGSHTHTISSAGSHSHSAGSHSHTYSGTTTAPNTGAIQALDQNPVLAAYYDHTHDYSGTTSSEAVTTDTQGDHDHGGTTGSTSAGTSGTGNPPFISGNYFIFTGVA